MEVLIRVEILSCRVIRVGWVNRDWPESRGHILRVVQHLMQVPTCTNIRIRSIQDAHKIFLAIQQGLLHMVTRRLDADERLALGTGCVYAWEERGPHSEITGLGIERFTEGRRWSPSRVRDEFLFYYEKFVPPPEAQSGPQSERLPPRDWDPLVKQTYSVWVETEKGRRKWHLTAYFTQATVDRLGTVDDIPGVYELVVPDGMFKSTRVAKSRSKSDEQSARSGEASKSTQIVTRTFAPFPGPAIYPQPPHVDYPNPVQQPTAVYPSYPEPHAYPMYYQGSAHPTHFASVPTSVSQVSRLPMHGSSQLFNNVHSHPSISTPSQIHYATETYERQEFHDKSLDDSQYLRFTSTPQSNPMSFPSAKSTQGLQQLHPNHNYNERLRATAVLSSVVHDTPHTHPLHSAPYARTYDHAPFTSSTSSHSMPTDATANPPYLIGGPNIITGGGGTYPPTHAHAHLRSESYSETNAQDNNSNLPPLHAVEGIQASVYALSNPGDILIPGEDRKSTIGPCRDLAPLHSLTRPHPYRREPLDDKTLRLLRPRD
ncbi:hypothetical protein AX17_003988 [Amanita inopinata Kibby_2008]|nr:hypothetical protein AX17_003988 [Amanita inopinata Kibby_2008]